MKVKQLNTVFLITTGISVFVFVYLVFLGYDDIKTVKDVIKILASIAFPIPILFFVRYVFIEHFLPENSEDYKLKNQKPATVLLVLTMVLGVSLLHVIEFITHQSLEQNLIVAHLINSTIISSYVLNFMLYNNLKINGVLSGLLLALAIHIFFFSN